MVNDPHKEHIIAWTDDGHAVEVKDWAKLGYGNPSSGVSKLTLTLTLTLILTLTLTMTLDLAHTHTLI